MDLLFSQLGQRAWPELAQALRSAAGEIILEWSHAVRQAIAPVNTLSFEELKNAVPENLSAMAGALAWPERQEIERLVEHARERGRDRFRKNYDVCDLLDEERLLRWTIVEQVEKDLARQMSAPEAAALHATIDATGREAVAALCREQHARLREAAEREHEHLAFLAHDLNNDLNAVTLTLKLLRQRLAGLSDEFGQAVQVLDLTQQSIDGTTSGMRRLVEHERLRKDGAAPLRAAPVDLHGLASSVVAQHARAAQAKGVAIAVEVEAGATAESDRELLTLVLQNLVGNAVKYSSKGTVRVRAERRRSDREGTGVERWVLSVSDEGPGIEREHQERIFETFRRGESHGQQGVGLGLAIASEAAKLLGADLAVESEIGVGATFRLTLPA